MTTRSRQSRQTEPQGSRIQEERQHSAGYEERDQIELLERGALDAPEPRDGFVQLWVRYTVDGITPDGSNLQKRLGQGWRPRPLDTIPKEWPFVKHRFEFGPIAADAAQSYGMILMERPVSIHRKKQQEIRQATRDQFLATKDNAFAFHRKQTRGVTQPRVFENEDSIERGRRAPVADD